MEPLNSKLSIMMKLEELFEDNVIDNKLLTAVNGGRAVTKCGDNVAKTGGSGASDSDAGGEPNDYHSLAAGEGEAEVASTGTLV